jgi:hypothetical protein
VGAAGRSLLAQCGEGVDHFSVSGSEPEFLNTADKCQAKQTPTTECLPATAGNWANSWLRAEGVGSASHWRFGDAQVDQFKNELMTFGPVAYAIHATNSFFGYASGVSLSGCDPIPPATSPPGANHAVVAIGWNTKDSVPVWDCLNSWGDGWGDRGKFKVATCAIKWYQTPGDMSGSASSWSFGGGAPEPGDFI